MDCVLKSERQEKIVLAPVQEKSVRFPGKEVKVGRLSVGLAEFFVEV